MDTTTAIGHCGEWVGLAERDGRFPRRVRVGKRSVTWREDAIADFVNSREVAAPLPAAA
jgi:predicted DNA-binding transcriptional regulator AlpA